ncbi:hypothetical protein J3459_014070 [Metarhizium acridum]|nr:hypothetical protein J3459_014070 [Metarhizium acridum]
MCSSSRSRAPSAPASSSAAASAVARGPLSAFICYAVTGLQPLLRNQQPSARGPSWLPIPGAVPVFAARYVDAALGSPSAGTTGTSLAIGVPIEATVCGVVVDYWPNDLPKAALVTLFSATMVLVELPAVRVYGEAEFAFGAVKLVTIVGLILLMFVITVGGSPAGDAIGFRYWNDRAP